MFSFARKLMATVMALTMTVGLSATALADETPEIKVQINGVNLAMQGNEPVMRNGSVFVPLRTIFEGLGAEISYDEATSTVSAARGSQAVDFVVGAKEMNVEKDGQKNVLTTENPSFVSNNSTYVPVRFVADALGANVEWDNNTQTVVIMDTTKLAADLDGKFTIMDKYLAYNKDFSTRALKFSGNVNYDMTIAEGEDAIPVKLTGTLSGITESDKMNMDMALKMDEASLKTLLEKAGAAEADAAEVKLVTDVLNNLSMEMIMDMNTGKFYIAMPAMANLLGSDANAWYELDFNALFAEAGLQGVTMAQLMQMNKTDSFVNAIVEMAKIMPIKTSEAGAGFAEVINTYVKYFGDDAFTATEDGYTTTYTATEAGATTSMTMKLTQADDKINGYTMDMTATVPNAGDMKMTASQLNDKCEVSMNFNVPGLLTMVFNADMTYTDTTDKALSKPANGAKIVSLNDLMSGTGAAESAA